MIVEYSILYFDPLLKQNLYLILNKILRIRIFRDDIEWNKKKVYEMINRERKMTIREK